MANEEHLERLQLALDGEDESSNKDAWADWRRENPKVWIDLSRADLRGANLSGMNLKRVDLSGADLSGSNLVRSNFRRADLREAKLVSANLSLANLRRADLREADLDNAIIHTPKLGGADFRRATLRNAQLANSILYGADLSKAVLTKANLAGADLTWARLSRTNLVQANMEDSILLEANLSNANLSEANLFRANLRRCNLNHTLLINADLREADLSNANLIEANLSNANMSMANLSLTYLVGVDLTGAKLNNCRIYGVSAWNPILDGAEQRDLIITPPEETTITVDNLKVAQFIYLLLRNEEVRGVIDSISSKVILILGRFTESRKAMLDAIREDLRQRDFLPVIFDFTKPANRDITETISTLAHMARFIIADITAAKSIPQELQKIVPDLPSVPILPLIHASSKEYGMFGHFKRYPWVLKLYRYRTVEDAIAYISSDGIAAVLERLRDLQT